jgi:protein-S-isoprenylcysteine O-methyltransferase Ste14
MIRRVAQVSTTLNRARKMAILFWAITYATFFVGFLFIYLPARFLSWAGIGRPAALGWPQIAGVTVGSIGAVVALWCVFAFVWIGRGTPAPFDPPRRLVIRGPYRFVRNPMYCGAGLALAGAALFYQSVLLLVYGGVFLLAAHLFVVYYEEPTLRQSFGPEYAAYCQHIHRWWPGVRGYR